MIPEAMSLITTPPKKPIKVLNPDLNASAELLPVLNSPKTAPTKGPIISPKGGKTKKPKTKPITLPHTARLEPPDLFADQTGIKLSKIVTPIAITAIIIMKFLEK